MLRYKTETRPAELLVQDILRTRNFLDTYKACLCTSKPLWRNTAWR